MIGQSVATADCRIADFNNEGGSAAHDLPFHSPLACNNMLKV